MRRLKGLDRRDRAEGEGYDDTYTYGVLAAEGFLPGYGLASGWVVGTFIAPRYSNDLNDWQIRRGSAMALREFVPGNLIYANGHKFIPRYYHFALGDGGHGPTRSTAFQVDVGNEAISELGEAATGGLGARTIRAVPMCDVDLPHSSHISDDEENRFQMPVATFGYERQRHGGGQLLDWGPRSVTHRRNVHFRLVNVGAANLVRGDNRLGYPVCLVCGQSRSPYAAEAERDKFARDHRERCGQQVSPTGFYADVVADAIGLPECDGRTEAYSVLEALRQGAASVLDMEAEDLQVLVTGRHGEEDVDGLLYDPMPGGSGLLDQMIEAWHEVVVRAREIVANCPAACDSSCPDCLQTFRNAYYHRHLSRSAAREVLDAWGDHLEAGNPIPTRMPRAPGGEQPVNAAEQTLEALLQQAGLHGFEAQKEIELGGALDRTYPDFFYEDPNGIFEGICIYLDGLSEHIHGNPVTQVKDRQIREQLRAEGYEVVEITYTELFDREAMRRHFGRLGRILVGKDRAREIREDPEWFNAVAPPVAHAASSELAIVHVPEGDDSGAPADTASGWGLFADLLGDDWSGLLEALESAGVPVPNDALWDLSRDGRVSGDKALLVWKRPERPLALVGVEVASTDADAEIIVLGDLEATAAELMERLEDLS